ncbi:MAG: SDR family NAD(P)-dependent oxidoreductase [Actinobacteria bacterium]|nr:SDR family NAD(P)-dependent oxidoreductase [Actinomycetota bacterium]
MTTFHGVDLPDRSGRTAIVTGASSGIGRSVAQALAGAGAHVVLAVRDLAKGRAVAAAIGGRTEVRALDLARLDSVRSFAAAWDGPIDLLINNAGVSEQTLTRTADGFEADFGVNHLGHFALTNLLLEQITGRVVTVASQAERMARLDLDDLNWTARPFQRSRAYNDSKLANLLFSAELQRRLTASGSPVKAIAAHPGLVNTAIYQHDGPRGLADFAWAPLLRLVAQDADHGALPVLFAATADVPGDSFAGPRHLAHMRGGFQLIGRSAAASDPALAGRLWIVSEQLTGVRSALAPAARP